MTVYPKCEPPEDGACFAYDDEACPIHGAFRRKIRAEPRESVSDSGREKGICSHEEAEHYRSGGVVTTCSKCDCPKYQAAAPSSELRERALKQFEHQFKGLDYSRVGRKELAIDFAITFAAAVARDAEQMIAYLDQLQSDYAKKYASETTTRLNWQGRAETAIRERDEARAELADYKDACGDISPADLEKLIDDRFDKMGVAQLTDIVDHAVTVAQAIADERKRCVEIARKHSLKQNILGKTYDTLCENRCGERIASALESTPDRSQPSAGGNRE